MQGVGPGSVLGGRYAVTVRTFEGAHHERWRANDHTLEREVVLVCAVAGGAVAAAALDAARRAAGVEDARLVRVLDVGSDHEVAFIVEEPLTGGVSVTDLLSSGGLPAEEVRRLVGETASALEKARQRGLHHLALTPDSVVRMPDGAVKVRGIATEAALVEADRVSGEPASRLDAIGLVKLAYAGLTARWPTRTPGTTADSAGAAGGGSDRDSSSPTPSVSLDPAPTIVGGVAPASEIVTGVPNDLDLICRMTLNDDRGPLSPGDLAQQIAPWAAGPPEHDGASGIGLASTKPSSSSESQPPQTPAPAAASTPRAPGRRLPAALRSRRRGASAASVVADAVASTGAAVGGTAAAGTTPAAGEPGPPSGAAGEGSAANPSQAVGLGVDRADPGPRDGAGNASTTSTTSTAMTAAPPPDSSSSSLESGSPESSLSSQSGSGSGAGASPAAGKGAGIAAAGAAAAGAAGALGDRVGSFARAAADKATAKAAERRAAHAADEWDDDFHLDEALDEAPPNRLEPAAPLLGRDVPEAPSKAMTRVLLAVIGVLVLVALAVGISNVMKIGQPEGPTAAGQTVTVTGTRPAPTPTSAPPTPTTTAPTTTAPPEPITITGGTGFDPQDDNTEADQKVKLVYDGKTSTEWTSRWYGTPKYNGNKDGVGVELDLDRSVVITEVELELPAKQDVTVYAANTADLDGAQKIGSVTDQDGTVTLKAPKGMKKATKLLVWVTKAAPAEAPNHYRAQISEVTVR